MHEGQQTDATLPIPVSLPLSAEVKEANVDLLANVISCVLDEALLERVGTFMWTDSVPRGSLAYAHAVPVNRWERACLHFWDTLFSTPVDVGPEDRRRLVLLLEDLFKAASRCRAGDVCFLMDRSVWHGLLLRLKDGKV